MTERRQDTVARLCPWILVSSLFGRCASFLAIEVFLLEFESVLVLAAPGWLSVERRHGKLPVSRNDKASRSIVDGC
jgi:hypothetical protein